MMAQSVLRPILFGAAFLVLAALFAAGSAFSKSKTEIDAQVQEALQTLYREHSSAQVLSQRAAGMLVFPEIAKGGLILGGEYGEGALMQNGQTVGYYSAASGSIGLQVGVQKRSQVIMFLSREALDAFLGSDGWEAGVDASINVIEAGTTADQILNENQNDIIGYVFGEEGVLAGVSIEGTKFERISR